MHYCDDPESREFLLGQNNSTKSVISVAQRLDDVLLDLLTDPYIALGPSWTSESLSTVNSARRYRDKLTEARPVPAPAAEVNRGFVKVGRGIGYVANQLEQAIFAARYNPAEGWQTHAAQAAEGLHNLEDSIEAVQEKVLDECG